MTVAVDDGRWRCFVGVPVGEDLRAVLSAHVAGWRADLDARWTDRAGWHCSLRFLGGIEPVVAQRFATALRDALRHEPRFVAATGPLDAFPSRGRARVLFYAVADPDGALTRLAGAVAMATGGSLSEAGSGGFRGHVTLARLRRPQRLTEWLASHAAPPGRLDVTEACLMRSRLGTGPARYERISCAPLAA